MAEEGRGPYFERPKGCNCLDCKDHRTGERFGALEAGVREALRMVDIAVDCTMEATDVGSCVRQAQAALEKSLRDFSVDKT